VSDEFISAARGDNTAMRPFVEIICCVKYKRRYINSYSIILHYEFLTKGFPI